MLYHYIVVRRDLPLGVCAAMLVHAAGESGAMYQDPADGSFKHAVAVVLEVKNEAKLEELAQLLNKNNVERAEVYESGGPYDKQLMAIGLVPCEREKVADLLKDYQTLKLLDNPSETA